jgi:pimeloyl-ACP methyl ester carboxylesterase
MAIALPFAKDSGSDLDPWPLLDGLADKPVLIVRGEISDLLSVQTAERMVEKLPKAELVTIPGIGHAPVLDEPEAVAGIERLLASVLSESSIQAD